MHFLAPSLLLGLLAAVVPWLLHRLGRRRANPVRFAAMELLLRAERQVSARRRLRDLLLLGVRTVAAAALPLLFARPYAEVRSDLPAAAQAPQTAVIVLDDSASMSRQMGGLAATTAFEEARKRARALVASMSPETDVALVLGSEGAPTPVAEPSTDRARLASALDAISVSARRGDLGAALTRATQIVRSGSHARRRIYLLSDMQASGFPTDGPTAPPGVSVTAVALSPEGGDASWDNRAVIDVAAEPAPEVGIQGIAVVAEVENFSSRPASHLGVTLLIDGTEVARGFIDVPAGGRAKKRFLHALAGGGGGHQAEVRIDADHFTLDDTRQAEIEVSRGLRVLLVDGDPRTVRNEDEVFFLDAALRAGGNRFQVQTALPDELAGRSLDAYSAIFLANVAHPSPAAAKALISYVDGGGGVFITVGDRVDSDAWNQTLRQILPQPLGLRRTAAARPGSPEGETVDDRPAERLAPIDRRQPLLSGFSADGGGLSSARFFQYLLLEPTTDSQGRTTLLRYETGAPALVERQVGRGRVLLLTTTADRDWTDLPIRPGFLPLIQEAARRLAGAPSSDAVTALTVGAPREIATSPDEKRIQVTKPDGHVVAVVPGDLPAGVAAAVPGAAPGTRVALFRETDQTGIYRVRAFRQNGSWVDRPDETFVVNLDTRESNPKLLDRARWPDRASPSVTGGAESESPLTRWEAWHFVGAALVFLLLLESMLTLKLRSERAR